MGEGLLQDFQGESPNQTLPVGMFEPNPWGLHDVHGNVWDWTDDPYCSDYPDCPADASRLRTWHNPYGDRVLRGGSWLDRPAQLRFACRQIYPQDEHNDMVGFRVALTLQALSVRNQPPSI